MDKELKSHKIASSKVCYYDHILYTVVKDEFEHFQKVVEKSYPTRNNTNKNQNHVLFYSPLWCRMVNVGIYTLQ